MTVKSPFQTDIVTIHLITKKINSKTGGWHGSKWELMLIFDNWAFDSNSCLLAVDTLKPVTYFFAIKLNTTFKRLIMYRPIPPKNASVAIGKRYPNTSENQLLLFASVVG